MSARPRAWMAFVALAAALPACATSPYKRAGNPAEVAAALARSQPPAAAGRSLVFLVLGGAAGPRIAAYDLSAARVVWTQPGDVTTRIAVGHDVIVHGGKAPGATEGSALIVARDIGNGAVLWQHPLAGDERLAGYDLDGNAVYLVVQTLGLTKRGTTGAVVALDPRSRARGARRSGRCSSRLAVRDPHRRHDGNGAGAGAVDRRGRDLRAAAARGDVLRFARRVPAVRGDGARLAAGARLSAGEAAAVRASVLLVRPLPSRAGAVLRHRSQPHPVARDRGGGSRALPRRHGRRARLPFSVRIRFDVGDAALGVHASVRRGRVDGHRQRDRVRQRRRRHRGARSRHGRAALRGAPAG